MPQKVQTLIQTLNIPSIPSRQRAIQYGRTTCCVARNEHTERLLLGPEGGRETRLALLQQSFLLLVAMPFVTSNFLPALHLKRWKSRNMTFCDLLPNQFSGVPHLHEHRQRHRLRGWRGARVQKTSVTPTCDFATYENWTRRKCNCFFWNSRASFSHDRESRKGVPSDRTG